jgi:hypothetical protein
MELKKQRKPGSGRKPIDNAFKKTALTIFLENRVIDTLGGQAKLKSAVIDFVESVYNSMHHDKTNPTNHRPNPNSLLP